MVVLWKPVKEKTDTHTDTKQVLYTILFSLYCMCFVQRTPVSGFISGMFFHNKEVKYVDSIQGQDHLCSTIQLVSTRKKM